MVERRSLVSGERVVVRLRCERGWVSEHGADGSGEIPRGPAKRGGGATASSTCETEGARQIASSKGEMSPLVVVWRR